MDLWKVRRTARSAIIVESYAVDRIVENLPSGSGSR